MQVKKFLKEWFIPPGINKQYLEVMRSINFVLAERFSRREVPDFNKIKKLKDIHKGERCFVLATGPSLGEMDLSPLAGEKIIAIHDSWLHPDFVKIKPQYHMIAPYHAPFTNSDIEKRLSGIKNTYHWPMKLFLGYTDYEFSVFNFIRSHPEYQFDDTFHINYSYGNVLTEENYTKPGIWDVSQKPFSPLTGNMQAIQIAIHLGFKEIILLGVDHNFAREISPNGNPHFYKMGVGQDDSEQRKLFYNREMIYIRLSQLWLTYRLIKGYAEIKGITIYNSTPKSELDVFLVESFDNLMNKK